MAEISWQREMRNKLLDLRATLDLPNHWADWEIAHIRKVCQNLDKELIRMSRKDEFQTNNLWEKQNFVKGDNG